MDCRSEERQKEETGSTVGIGTFVFCAASIHTRDWFSTPIQQFSRIERCKWRTIALDHRHCISVWFWTSHRNTECCPTDTATAEDDSLKHEQLMHSSYGDGFKSRCVRRPKGDTSANDSDV